VAAVVCSWVVFGARTPEQVGGEPAEENATS